MHGVLRTQTPLPRGSGGLVLCATRTCAPKSMEVGRKALEAASAALDKSDDILAADLRPQPVTDGPSYNTRFNADAEDSRAMAGVGALSPPRRVRGSATGGRPVVPPKLARGHEIGSTGWDLDSKEVVLSASAAVRQSGEPALQLDATGNVVGSQDDSAAEWARLLFAEADSATNTSQRARLRERHGQRRGGARKFARATNASNAAASTLLSATYSRIESFGATAPARHGASFQGSMAAARQRGSKLLAKPVDPQLLARTASAGAMERLTYPNAGSSVASKGVQRRGAGGGVAVAWGSEPREAARHRRLPPLAQAADDTRSHNNESKEGIRGDAAEIGGATADAAIQRRMARRNAALRTLTETSLVEMAIGQRAGGTHAPGWLSGTVADASVRTQPWSGQAWKDPGQHQGADDSAGVDGGDESLPPNQAPQALWELPNGYQALETALSQVVGPCPVGKSETPGAPATGARAGTLREAAAPDSAAARARLRRADATLMRTRFGPAGRAQVVQQRAEREQRLKTRAAQVEEPPARRRREGGRAASAVGGGDGESVRPLAWLVSETESLWDALAAACQRQPDPMGVEAQMARGGGAPSLPPPDGPLDDIPRAVALQLRARLGVPSTVWAHMSALCAGLQRHRDACGEMAALADALRGIMTASSARAYLRARAVVEAECGIKFSAPAKIRAGRAAGAASLPTEVAVSVLVDSRAGPADRSSAAAYITAAAANRVLGRLVESARLHIAQPPPDDAAAGLGWEAELEPTTADRALFLQQQRQPPGSEAGSEAGRPHPVLLTSGERRLRDWLWVAAVRDGVARRVPGQSAPLVPAASLVAWLWRIARTAADDLMSAASMMARAGARRAALGGGGLGGRAIAGKPDDGFPEGGVDLLQRAMDAARRAEAVKERERAANARLMQAQADEASRRLDVRRATRRKARPAARRTGVSGHLSGPPAPAGGSDGLGLGDGGKSHGASVQSSAGEDPSPLQEGSVVHSEAGHGAGGSRIASSSAGDLPAHAVHNLTALQTRALDASAARAEREQEVVRLRLERERWEEEEAAVWKLVEAGSAGGTLAASRARSRSKAGRRDGAGGPDRSQSRKVLIPAAGPFDGRAWWAGGAVLLHLAVQRMVRTARRKEEADALAAEAAGGREDETRMALQRMALRIQWAWRRRRAWSKLGLLAERGRLQAAQLAEEARLEAARKREEALLEAVEARAKATWHQSRELALLILGRRVQASFSHWAVRVEQAKRVRMAKKLALRGRLRAWQDNAALQRLGRGAAMALQRWWRKTAAVAAARALGRVLARQNEGSRRIIRRIVMRAAAAAFDGWKAKVAATRRAKAAAMRLAKRPAYRSLKAWSSWHREAREGRARVADWCQSRWRGRRVRWVVLQQLCARRIQRLFRRRKERRFACAVMEARQRRAERARVMGRRLLLSRGWVSMQRWRRAVQLRRRARRMGRRLFTSALKERLQRWHAFVGAARGARLFAALRLQRLLRRRRALTAARRLLRQHAAARAAQAWWRSLAVRWRYRAIVRRHRGAEAIQRVWRGGIARKLARGLRWRQASAVAVQRVWRGHSVRQGVRWMQQEELLGAIEAGNYTGVRRTLEAWGAWAASATDRSGSTALMRAALHGRRRILKLLLRWGADPNTAEPKRGWSALHLLASARPFAKQHELIEYLVTRGADPDLPDSQGRRPLHVAAERGWAGVIAVLLGLRADAEAVDGFRQAPVHVAAKHGKLGALRELLQGTYPVSTVCRDVKAQTPLHLATEGGYYGLVELLIDVGKAAVSVRRFDGQSPLHIAAAVPGAPPAASRAGSRRASPLPSPEQLAVVLDPATATSLVPEGVAGDEGSSDALTSGPGLHAVFDRIAIFLVARGADVAVLDSQGRTPLHMAAAAGRTGVIALLFEADADVRAKDIAGDTPLHTACRQNQPLAVAAMLAHGASPDDRNAQGDTALHVCCAMGHLDCIEEVFRHECDPNLRNFANRTALGEARMNNQPVAVAALFEEFVPVELDAAGRPVRQLEWLTTADVARERLRLAQQETGASRLALPSLVQGGVMASPAQDSFGAFQAVQKASGRVEALDKSEDPLAQLAGDDKTPSGMPEVAGAGPVQRSHPSADAAANRGGTSTAGALASAPALPGSPIALGGAGLGRDVGSDAEVWSPAVASIAGNADAASAAVVAAPARRKGRGRRGSVVRVGGAIAGSRSSQWRDLGDDPEADDDAGDQGLDSSGGAGLEFDDEAGVDTALFADESVVFAAELAGGSPGGVAGSVRPGGSAALPGAGRLVPGGGVGMASGAAAAAHSRTGAAAQGRAVGAGGTGSVAGRAGGGGVDGDEDEDSALGDGTTIRRGAVAADEGALTAAAERDRRARRVQRSLVSKEEEARSWEKRVRLADGEELWFNRVTGEARGDRPPELGGGWEPRFDSGSGRVVWRNAATGEISRTDPEVLAPAALARRGAGKAEARRHGGTTSLPSRVELRRRRDPLREEVGEEAVADYAAQQRDFNAEVALSRRRIAAAKRIQHAWANSRALRALARIRVWRIAAVEAQRVCRGWLGRRKAAERRRQVGAATAVQRVWRGILGRRRWWREWQEQAEAWGCVSVQRVWRGFVGRRLANTARVRRFAWEEPAAAQHWLAVAGSSGAPLRRWRGWLEFAVVPPLKAARAQGHGPAVWRDWEALASGLRSPAAEVFRATVRLAARDVTTEAMRDDHLKAMWRAGAVVFGPDGSVVKRSPRGGADDQGEDAEVWGAAAAGDADEVVDVTAADVGAWRRRQAPRATHAIAAAAAGGASVFPSAAGAPSATFAGGARPVSPGFSALDRLGPPPPRAEPYLDDSVLPRLPRSARRRVPGDAARVYVRWRDWRPGEGAEAAAVRFGPPHKPRFPQLTEEEEDALLAGTVSDDRRAASGAIAELTAVLAIAAAASSVGATDRGRVRKGPAAVPEPDASSVASAASPDTEVLAARDGVKTDASRGWGFGLGRLRRRGRAVSQPADAEQPARVAAQQPEAEAAEAAEEQPAPVLEPRGGHSPPFRRWAVGEGRLEQPRAWLRAERRAVKAADQARNRGWTDEEEAAARSVQWFVKQARRKRDERKRLRAVAIMEAAQDTYLDNPKDIATMMNYALWCQTTGRALERAKPLYLGLVDHMTRRGPDHPLILYGFSLLLAGTLGEDFDVIEALAQRARRADVAKGGGAFDVAERGFFAEALRRAPDDAEALLGMALVHTFVHSDIDAAEPLFLRAMEVDPTRAGLVDVFSYALVARGGRDYDGHEAYRRLLERRATAEAEEVSARLLEAQHGARMTNIQRVWRGYRVRDALRTLRETAELSAPLSHWERHVDPATGAAFFLHAPSGVTSWLKPSLVPLWGALRACGVVTGFGVVTGGGCELGGVWRGGAPRPGPGGWRRRRDGRGFEQLAAQAYSADAREATRPVHTDWVRARLQAAEEGGGAERSAAALAEGAGMGKPPLLHGADPRGWAVHVADELGAREAPQGALREAAMRAGRLALPTEDGRPFWFHEGSGESRWEPPRWSREPRLLAELGCITRRHVAKHGSSPAMTGEGDAFEYGRLVLRGDAANFDLAAARKQELAERQRLELLSSHSRRPGSRSAAGVGSMAPGAAARRPPPGMGMRRRLDAAEVNRRALMDAPLRVGDGGRAPPELRDGTMAAAEHWVRTTEDPTGGANAASQGIAVWVNEVTGAIHEGSSPPTS